jgi:hypothetical protein
LLADGDFDYSSQGRIKIYCTGTTSPREPTKEGPLSFVLYESPFTLVSTVSRGQVHPSLVSLVKALILRTYKKYLA